METEIVNKSYLEIKLQDLKEGSEEHRVLCGSNFNGIFDMLKLQMVQKGYSFQEKKLSKELKMELYDTYNSFEVYSSYSFEKRKGMILPKNIFGSDFIEIGGFKNAGNHNNDGFILRSNNSDLISRVGIDIHQFGRYDLGSTYGGD
jgi:hypothetical protein